jgi:hypothetical protein
MINSNKIRFSSVFLIFSIVLLSKLSISLELMKNTKNEKWISRHDPLNALPETEEDMFDADKSLRDFSLGILGYDFNEDPDEIFMCEKDERPEYEVLHENAIQFAKAFNHVVESIENGKANNFSFKDIPEGKLCEYETQNGTENPFTTANKEEKPFVQNIYNIAQKYFINLLKTPFWINYLHFQKCYIIKDNKDNKLQSHWKILFQHTTAEHLVESKCTITNLFNTVLDKVEFINRKEPSSFYHMGQQLRRFFLTADPHLHFLNYIHEKNRKEQLEKEAEKKTNKYLRQN